MKLIKIKYNTHTHANTRSWKYSAEKHFTLAELKLKTMLLTFRS